MESFGEGGGKDDLHYRRLKNRERQRRYRERKRLQEELKKHSMTGNEVEPLRLLPPPLPPPTTLSPPTTLTNGVHADNRQSMNNRVLCRRNWKKDARRAAANMAKQQTSCDHAQSVDGNLESKTSSETKLAEQNSATCSSSSLMVAGDAKLRVKRGGRHWKAEARKRQEVKSL